MQPCKTLTGFVAPLMRENVGTDTLIRIERSTKLAHDRRAMADAVVAALKKV